VKNKSSHTYKPTKFAPRIGITMGDAAGIGPEIILKALLNKKTTDNYLPVVIGDARFLRQTAEELNLVIDFEVIRKDEQIPTVSEKIIVFDLENIQEEIRVGMESGVAGKASAEYISKAVALCQKGKIEAIATAPISKKALLLGGYDFPGHTEMLAYLTNTKDFAMSFFAEKLRVVLLSTHLSLLDAIALVKKDKLVKLINFTHRELSKLLRKDVKIAVAGLNPHASEGGMFGTEESSEIIPAIEHCRKTLGINVSGAYSPDTIFLRAFRGEFDAVVSCYHDQATIAVKCLSFGESVNVTLGLPIIRTSVDHGTAFDIAGKNMADYSSMETAIKLGARLVIGAVS
jgi:4-phospho-D-threonate 3-dehydrogenase / 4-phospho-D-erythronate 3-dehydrogenase